MSAEEADRLEKKKKKKNPDQGFAGTYNRGAQIDTVQQARGPVAFSKLQKSLKRAWDWSLPIISRNVLCIIVFAGLVLGYEAASFRQYQRNTKQMKVNMDEYERKKEKM